MLQRGTYKARLASLQLHQGEGRSAIRSIGISQRLQNFEVIEVRCLDKFDGFSGGLYGGSKISVLALELRGLMAAVCHDDRCTQ